MKIHIHQTHHKIADFPQITKDLKQIVSHSEKGIHLFPELFLTGYPLQDLCLQKPFFNNYLRHLEDIRKDLKDAELEGKLILVGGLEYELTEEGNPLNIRNVVFELSPNKNLEPIYTKRLLPNYDIFDEKKYFTKGEAPQIIEFNGLKYGLLICEDMWTSSFYDLDPVQDLIQYCQKHDHKLSGILNLSASPFHIYKDESRLARGKEISQMAKCPFYYCNRIGGEDEILFDGGSFIVNNDHLIKQAAFFKADTLIIDQAEIKETTYPESINLETKYTWEDLFEPQLAQDHNPPRLRSWNDETCESVLQALMFGFQEYATRNNFSKFSLALSGGMDSALALTLIKLSLNETQSVEAVYMPSVHSSSLSYDLSLGLCENLGVPFKSMPIKFLHSTAKNLFGQTFTDPFEGLTDENIQSRLRGLLIYTRSNQTNSMVVNTSNKSELSVGYSTQYGDSVGAISLLGDLYKTEVYQLAAYINRKHPDLIPSEIITRPPSAELRPDQKDTDSLPPYEVLDALLECVLTYRHDRKSLLGLGFQAKDIDRVLDLYRKNEYKRYQFCPILKISSKSFGFGYRIPLTKASEFYKDFE